MIFFFSLSCSTYQSTNFIKEGTFLLKDGAYGHSWNGELKFKRVSWYQQATLMFDFLIAELNPSSPYQAWLSADMLENKKKCQRFYIVLDYSLESDHPGYSHIDQQFRVALFEKIHLPLFESNIKMHPQYVENSMRLYRLYGLCDHNNLKEIALVLPGYVGHSLSLSF